MPEHLETDHVMPSVSELPKLVSSIRHPRRHRSVSIGPQSEADAYETLAFREQAWRKSLSTGSGHGLAQPAAAAQDPNGQMRTPDEILRKRQERGNRDGTATPDYVLVDRPDEKPRDTLAAPPKKRTPSQQRRDDEKEKKEIFSKVQKPRVRYDVEVVTKLIVYCGGSLELTRQYTELTLHRDCMDRLRVGSNPVRAGWLGHGTGCFMVTGCSTR